MVTQLGANPTEASQETHDTRGAHSKFSFLTKLYKNHVRWALNVISDVVHV